MITVEKRVELERRRKKAKMSQLLTGHQIGVSQSQYSLIELGWKNPTSEQAEKLIELFDLDADYFASAKGC